jgi:DNA (cytosine-5)-methyltransferase 3A
MVVSIAIGLISLAIYLFFIPSNVIPRRSKAICPQLIPSNKLNTTIIFSCNKYYINNAVKILDGKPDIIIGGSPCQNFSALRVTLGNKIDGLDGDKSKLFYEYLRLLREIEPTYFLLENVRMKLTQKKELDNYLGVEGMGINSSLVSFQTRSRYYWTNIHNVTLPIDKAISYQDYKDTDEQRCDEAMPNQTKSRIRMWNNGNGNVGLGTCVNITNADKVGCLTRKQDRCPNSGMVAYKGFARYLTRREQELAQTLPIGYCDHLSYNQTCDVIGDGWTVDVIKHILSFMPKGAI